MKGYQSNWKKREYVSETHATKTCVKWHQHEMVTNNNNKKAWNSESKLHKNLLFQLYRKFVKFGIGHWQSWDATLSFQTEATIDQSLHWERVDSLVISKSIFQVGFILLPSGKMKNIFISTHLFPLLTVSRLELTPSEGEGIQVTGSCSHCTAEQLSCSQWKLSDQDLEKPQNPAGQISGFPINMKTAAQGLSLPSKHCQEWALQMFT